VRRRAVRWRNVASAATAAVWSQAEVVGATGREQHRKRASQEDMYQGMTLHRRQRGGRVKVLLYICPRTTMYVSSYLFTCVRILVLDASERRAIPAAQKEYECHRLLYEYPN
jgi:hypothetical protein